MDGPYGAGPSPGLSDPSAPALPDDTDWLPFYKLPVGDVLGATFSGYFAGFFKYTLLSLLALSPTIVYAVWVLSSLSTDNTWQMGMSLQYQIWIIKFSPLLFQPIATGAIIYGVFRRQRNQPAGFGKCLGVGLGRLLHLLGVSLLTGLGAVGILLPGFIGGMIPFLGFLILLAALVFVIIFVIAASMAAPATVVERIGVVAAFSRSFAMTRGNRWRIFAVVLVIGLIQLAITLVLGLVLGATSAASFLADQGSLITSLRIETSLDLGLSVIFGAISAVAAGTMFYRFKVQAEGVDEVELASVFD